MSILKDLKATLDQKQYKEWYVLLKEMQESRKSLTRSLIVKNKVTLPLII